MAETFDADVVFVGSGVAAAIAGAALANAGAKVLFLEAGPVTDHGTALTYFQASPSKSLNSPYPNQPYAPQPDDTDYGAYYVQMGPLEFRGQQTRVAGGTTWHWEGSAMRFKPNDFRMQSTFGVAVDWPIGYDDLSPWYDVAEDQIGVACDDDLKAAIRDNISRQIVIGSSGEMLPDDYNRVELSDQVDALGIPRPAI